MGSYWGHNADYHRKHRGPIIWLGDRPTLQDGRPVSYLTRALSLGRMYVVITTVVVIGFVESMILNFQVNRVNFDYREANQL